MVLCFENRAVILLGEFKDVRETLMRNLGKAQCQEKLNMSYLRSTRVEPTFVLVEEVGASRRGEYGRHRGSLFRYHGIRKCFNWNKNNDHPKRLLALNI